MAEKRKRGRPSWFMDVVREEMEAERKVLSMRTQSVCLQVPTVQCLYCSAKFETLIDLIYVSSTHC